MQIAVDAQAVRRLLAKVSRCMLLLFFVVPCIGSVNEPHSLICNLATAGSLGGFRFDKHAPYDASRKSLIRRYKLPSDRWLRSICLDERVQVLSSSSANLWPQVASMELSTVTSTSPTDLLTVKTRLWWRRWKNASTHHQRKLALVWQEESFEETADMTCI
jgi:hypothetical protein